MDAPDFSVPVKSLRDANVPGMALPRLQGPGGRQLIVLLADDNAVNRAVGVAMLEQLGLQVHTANDGREAVDKADAAAYDVVLMDVQMPRLDGLDATRAIRALPRHGQVPVIALTANALEHNRAACMAAGMNEFLCKPINVWQLAGALARWLPR